MDREEAATGRGEEEGGREVTAGLTICSLPPLLLLLLLRPEIDRPTPNLPRSPMIRTSPHRPTLFHFALGADDALDLGTHPRVRGPARGFGLFLRGSGGPIAGMDDGCAPALLHRCAAHL